MSCLVYAFTDTASPRVDVEGGPLRTVADGAVAAIVRGHAEPRLEYSAPALLDYERVMERLMASRAILPARFGTVLADDEEVRTLLRERQAELTRALERVRGAIELGTRVRWRDGAARSAPVGGEGPGTQYLAGRAALHQRARDLARRLDPLADLARDVRRRLDADENFPVRDAYLVERDRMAGFARAVQSIDEGDPEIEMVCTGPWPPYSFAHLIDNAARPGSSSGGSE